MEDSDYTLDIADNGLDAINNLLLSSTLAHLHQVALDDAAAATRAVQDAAVR